MYVVKLTPFGFLAAAAAGAGAGAAAVLSKPSATC